MAAREEVPGQLRRQVAGRALRLSGMVGRPALAASTYVRIAAPRLVLFAAADARRVMN